MGKDNGRRIMKLPVRQRRHSNLAYRNVLTKGWVIRSKKNNKIMIKYDKEDCYISGIYNTKRELLEDNESIANIIEPVHIEITYKVLK